MDSFGDFLPFLLGGAYLAFRFLGARRTANRRNVGPQRLDDPSRDRSQTPGQRRKAGSPNAFEQLVGRLEEQARAASLPPQPPPLEPPPRSRARVAEAPRPSAIGTAMRGSFADETAGYAQETAGFDHRATDYAHGRHGFGSANPLSEESFERSGPRDLPAPAFDPHGLLAPAATRRASSLPLAIRTPQALRDAFVLQTILTRPAPLRRSARPAGEAPPEERT